jgi:hypothetical protein
MDKTAIVLNLITNREPTMSDTMATEPVVMTDLGSEPPRTAKKLRQYFHRTWDDMADPYRMAVQWFKDPSIGEGQWEQEALKQDKTFREWDHDGWSKLSMAERKAKIEDGLQFPSKPRLFNTVGGHFIDDAGTLTKLGRFTHGAGQLAGPVMDVVDVGSRIAAGDPVPRAVAGAAGSIPGWSAGYTAGAMLAPALAAIPIPGVGAALALAAPYVGGMIGSSVGDWMATGAYEAVTEDEVEQARKAAERGESPDQVDGSRVRAIEADRTRAALAKQYAEWQRNSSEEIMDRMKQQSKAAYQVPEI